MTVTFDPTKEKISSSLEVYGPYVLAALAGLSEKIGLPYPRVGHLVEIDRQTGAIAHVFNSECSNRTTVIVPSTCPEGEAGIWGRIPATVDPSGNLLVATADGAWNGRTDWGDSVLELSPSLEPLQSYTPADQAKLTVDDLDLGSTAPVLLTPHLVLQAGKDGVIRLLDLDKLNGRTHAAGPYLGGEISTAEAPKGAAVLRAAGRLAAPGPGAVGVRGERLRDRGLRAGAPAEAAPRADVVGRPRRLEPDHRGRAALRLQRRRGRAQRLRPRPADRHRARRTSRC